MNLDYQNSFLGLKANIKSGIVERIRKCILKIIKIFIFILKSKLLSKGAV